MKRNNITLIVIAIVTLLVTVIGATYAYFATGSMNITNVVNANTVTEQNNMVFDTLGGAMLLNVTASNMVEAKQGNIAAENNTTLTVNFTANTDYSMVCTYDIVYEWTSTDKYTAHTSGVSSNEFTIQGTLTSNSHLNEGANIIYIEKDLSTLTYTNYSATVVSGAQIDGTGSTTSTAVWTITSKFYNVDGDQSALSNKTYTGNFRVANVSCVAGTASPSGPTSYWFILGGRYEFPEYGGTLQSNGSATGQDVYMGQNDSKYFTCINYYGYEVCLSQPYTQYGLYDHTEENSFTSEQKSSAKQALWQTIIDAGIPIDIDNDCGASATSVYCMIENNNHYCRISASGHISCYGPSSFCEILSNGQSNCGN